MPEGSPAPLAAPCVNPRGAALLGGHCGGPGSVTERKHQTHWLAEGEPEGWIGCEAWGGGFPARSRVAIGGGPCQSGGGALTRRKAEVGGARQQHGGGGRG